MAYHEKRLSLLIVVVIVMFCPLSNNLWAQDNGSIGIGTETPNSNAVLELVSPGNNQGLLVPRLTTAQRTNTDFTSNLSNLENGLLVFDTDQNAFFFWMTDQWIEVGNTQFTAGDGIEISNGVISNSGDDDADPSNEIQTISIVNDSLVLSNGGGSVAIDADNSDEIQNLTFDEATNTLSISDGNDVDLSAWISENDSDSTNEIQDLQIASDILSITNNTSATDIDLTGYLDNTDDQQLTLSGTDLSIESGNSVDLSTLVDDSDADPTNEIQDLSLSASNTLTITGNASATEIDLSPFSGTNTDNQSLTYDNSSSYTISISNGNTIDISDLKDDNDADPTNEIELPSTATTGEVLVYDGSSWVAGTDNVDDADNDATNEIELPSTATTGDILVYDGANWVAGTDNVDDADNDATNEIELPATADNGDILTYARGVWIAGTDDVNDADSDPTNEIELPSTATTGDILVYDGANWVAGTDNVNDADSDASNELQGLSYNATTNALSISTSGSASVNLSELDDTFSSPWSDDGSTVTYSGDYATANNFVARPNSEIISISSGGNTITRDQIKFSKIIQIKGADAANVRAIEPGVDGQQLICIVVDTQAIFVNQDSGTGTSQIILSANSHTLGAGSTIHLVYNEALGGWLEISYSIAAGRG
ncbi:MAG: hypothetical protein NXI20_10400 [bacterium]|nr:hypothetical protein [bacterium]